mmetsp:Transcript_10563/g.64948  ORF Transcript_10563/g.64948 Transcript_10563/m.64948 type:complete len:187 (+) Transcript_10563:742-1302(+)
MRFNVNGHSSPVLTRLMEEVPARACVFFYKVFMRCDQPSRSEDQLMTWHGTSVMLSVKAWTESTWTKVPSHDEDEHVLSCVVPSMKVVTARFTSAFRCCCTIEMAAFATSEQRCSCFVIPTQEQLISPMKNESVPSAFLGPKMKSTLQMSGSGTSARSRAGIIFQRLLLSKATNGANLKSEGLYRT